jgi:hypothetical protein
MIAHALIVTIPFDQVDDVDHRERPDDDAGLFHHLAAGRLEHRLAQLLQAARQAPLAQPRRLGAPDEQHATVADDDGADADEREVRVFAWHRRECP